MKTGLATENQGESWHGTIRPTTDVPFSDMVLVPFGSASHRSPPTFWGISTCRKDGSGPLCRSRWGPLSAFRRKLTVVQVISGQRRSMYLARSLVVLGSLREACVTESGFRGFAPNTIILAPGRLLSLFFKASGIESQISTKSSLLHSSPLFSLHRATCARVSGSASLVATPSRSARACTSVSRSPKCLGSSACSCMSCFELGLSAGAGRVASPSESFVCFTVAATTEAVGHTWESHVENCFRFGTHPSSGLHLVRLKIRSARPNASFCATRSSNGSAWLGSTSWRGSFVVSVRSLSTNY